MNNADIYWPGWTTVKKIGSGGFGAVYEIQRDLLGETEKAALKVITVPAEPEEIDELYGEGYDMQSLTSRYIGQRDDILREYQLMRKLNGHTHVVNCDDIQYSQHSDRLGWDIKIKMELLTPLTKLPPEHFTEEQVIKLGSDICDALALCRMNSIIHRDIKPQNIFVSDDGEYKLGDFGIARTMEHTASGTKIGTYKFMAPEVYNNQPYNATVDIYSLGLVLYWLLNGRRMPFLKPGVINPSEEEEARRRRFAGDAIPAPVYGGRELQRIVLKACEFDAKRRWQTAEEMKQALDALLYGETRGTAAEMPKRAEAPKPAPKAERPKPEPKPKAETPKPAPKPKAERQRPTLKDKFSVWQSTALKALKKPEVGKIKPAVLNAFAGKNEKLARLRFIPPVFAIMGFGFLGNPLFSITPSLYIVSAIICYYLLFPWKTYVDVAATTFNYTIARIFATIAMMIGDFFVGFSIIGAEQVTDGFDLMSLLIIIVIYICVYLFRGYAASRSFDEFSEHGDLKRKYRLGELVSYVVYLAFAFVLVVFA